MTSDARESIADIRERYCAAPFQVRQDVIYLADTLEITLNLWAMTLWALRDEMGDEVVKRVLEGISRVK